MADFRAKIEAFVDTSKAASDINSFVNQQRRMNIEVNLQLNQASQALHNLLQQMQNQGGNAGTQFAGQFVQAVNSGMQQINATQTVNQIEKQTNRLTVNIRNNMRDLTRQQNAFNETTAKTFGNQMTAWARNNGKAVKVYGDQLNGLQTRLRSAIDSGDGNAVRQLREEFRLLQSEARATGNVGKTFAESFSSSLGSVAKFAASYVSLYRVFNELKQGVQTVVELDTALVDLQKTSTATPRQLNSFYKEANDIAKQYGTTTQQIIQGAADWSRLGYNLEDAKTMSKLSSQFAAISPGMSVDMATTSLVSTMKAFGIEADNVLDGVMSKVNAVGNSFALSNDDIMVGLQNSSSAMAVANNSLDETIALITAGTEIVQDSSKVGNALRTISMRIRGMNEETEQLDDGLVNIKGDVYELTNGKVSIMEDPDTYKSTTQILREVANIWDELSDKSQANLLEKLFGKTRAQVGAAILSNFDQVEKALDVMSKSAGNADKEMDIITNSLDYKINALKETFTGIWQNIFSREDLGGLVDFATGIAEVLDGITEKLGLFGSAIVGGGIVSGVMGLANAFKAFSSASGALTMVQALSGAFPGLSAAIGAFSTAMATTGGAAGVLHGALSGLFSLIASHPILAIATAMGVAYLAFDTFNESVEEANEKMRNSFSAYEDAKQNVTDCYTQLSDIESKMDALSQKKSPTFVEEAELEKLRESAQLLRIEADLAEKEEKRAAKQAVEDTVEAFNKSYGNWGEISDEAVQEQYDNTSWSGRVTYNGGETIWGEKYETDIVTGLSDLRMITEKKNQAYQDMSQAYEEAKKYLDEDYDSLSRDEKDLVDTYNDYSEEYDDYAEIQESIATLLEKQIPSLTEYKSNFEKLGLENLDDTQREVYDSVNDSIRMIYEATDPAKWKQMQFDKIFDHAAFKQAKDDMIEIALASENLGVTIDDVRETLGEKLYGQLDEELTKAGFSMQDFVNQVNSEANILDIDRVKDNIKKGIDSAVEEATGETETIKPELEVEPDITVANDKDEKAKFDEWVDGLSDEYTIALSKLMSDSSIDTSTWDTAAYQDYLDSLMKNNGEIVESNQEVSESVDDVYNSFKTNFDKIRSTVQGQSTGKSLSPEDFASDELKEYSKALEYHNGVLQYNAEKVAEISKAKAEETKQTIAANKAMEQVKYLENAGQIEKLRASLKGASGSEKIAINETIQSLLNENRQIVDTCNHYNLMINAINEATSAYQNWVNAQSASQSGEMFDSALSAMRKIDDTLNNATSDSYGRIGNADYKAAVDFIVPDTVDHDDTEAITAYMDSIANYLTFDDNGNAKGLNIEEFCKQATEAGLMTLDEATSEYKIAGEKTMKDFADGLGLSLPLVQAMFGEMEEFGGHFDWADEMEKSYGDLAVEANEAAESLRHIQGNENLKIVLDVSEFEDKETAIATLDETIQQMNDLKAKPGVDTSEIEQANSIIQYCVAQKQLLNSPSVMHVDTSQVTGELGHALELLQQFQTAKNQVEMQASIGADTSAAEAELNGLVAEIQGISPEVQATLGITSASVDTITASIQALSPEMIVKAGVDSSLVDEFASAEHNGDGTITWDNNTGAVDSYASSTKHGSGIVNWTNNIMAVRTFFTATGIVNWVNSGSPKKGSHGVNGTAHAFGTARARGDWGTAPGGTTLVGELGQEIVVDPHSGLWYTVGDHGAEFRDIPKGAIVFNHLQSKSLLANGYAIGRASALATGTAMVTGGIRMTKYTSSSGSSSSSSRSSSGSSSSYRSNYYSEPVSYDDDEDDYSSSSSDDDEEIEKLDWIEIAIDRIERLIENLGRVAESTFKKLANRLKATDEEIESIAEEIAIQQAGEQRYLEQASSVGLSETLAEKVRNGSIDISEYDKETQELIDDYKEWYEKALDCADAVDELHENLASLYQDRFDMVEKDFDNQLSLIEHLTNTYENGIDEIEERGYLMTTKYYEASRKAQQENIQVLNKELTELIKKMSDGINSGEIEEGSEAWYEMQISINDVKEAIQEANTEVIKLGNSIRKTNWEHFDYLQERISAVTEEADFLISLMEHSDLFDDNGQLSSTGMATMGVHGQNYNVYMNQADRYANEIKRINAEIAKDSADTELIERREELLKLQRESILNAEDEKDAIKDLVEEGIKTELDALKEVISAYKESLDSAQDLYDYQKKLRNQAKDVTDIQKQLAAYAGDNSEESRATIQRLNSKLNDAVEKLEETEQERTIKEQKAMLDNLYSEYEAILNERLDNVDALISDMIDTINNNASNIGETLISEADDVGYTISDSMRSIWASGGEASSVIAKYGDSFLSEMTSVNIVLNGIAANVAKMIAASDTTAQEVINSTTKTTDPLKPPAKPKPSPTQTPTQKSNERTDQDYYGVAFAIWEGIYGWGAGDDRVSRLKSKGFDPAKVQSLVNSVYGDYMNDRFSKYGISSDLSKYGYNKYLDGGLVKYTGLAQVDGSPSRPESFLDATDTANLAKLTSAMRTTSPFARNSNGLVNLRSGIADGGVGDIIYNINIPIEHVSDYNDFMNQMRQDSKFEKFVQSVTIGRVNGETRLAKNKYNW